MLYVILNNVLYFIRGTITIFDEIKITWQVTSEMNQVYRTKEI